MYEIIDSNYMKNRAMEYSDQSGDGESGEVTTELPNVPTTTEPYDFPVAAVVVPIVVVLLIFAGGFAFYYYRVKKSGKELFGTSNKGSTDPAVVFKNSSYDAL